MFPYYPEILVKADCDSIYKYSHDFENLLESFGQNTHLEIQATINQNRKAKSSRFYLNCSELNNKPIVRNTSSSRIPLHFFPNVEIARLHVEGIHKPLHICLHNLRETNLKRDRHFFSHEMATITACLNIARQMGIDSNPGDQELKQEFIDFYPVELNYGSKEFRQDENHESNELSAKAMMEFARNFGKALKLIAEDDEDCPYEFWEIQYHQTRDEDDTKRIQRREMRGAAQELMNGILFTATVAGIKKNFTKDKFQSKVNQTWAEIDGYKQKLLDNYEAIVSETNQKILETHSLQEGDTLPDGVRLFSVDPEAENAMEIKHVKKNLTCFLTFFGNYYSDLDKKIHRKIQELCDEVDTDLRKKFNTLQSDSEEQIFFDIGAEFRFMKDNSMLIDLSRATDQMKTI